MLFLIHMLELVNVLGLTLCVKLCRSYAANLSINLALTVFVSKSQPVSKYLTLVPVCPFFTVQDFLEAGYNF